MSVREEEEEEEEEWGEYQDIHRNLLEMDAAIISQRGILAITQCFIV